MKKNIKRYYLNNKFLWLVAGFLIVTSFFALANLTLAWNSGISCNSVTLDVNPKEVKPGEALTFSLRGDASTYSTDETDWGAFITGSASDWTWGGSSATRRMVVSDKPNTYTWTHKWRHCSGSTDQSNCSADLCSTSVSYKIVSNVLPTATTAPSATSVPSAAPSATSAPTAPVLTPTSTPAPTFKTIAYRYSDSQFSSNDSKPDWAPYTHAPTVQEYTFKNPKPGTTVTIFAQFKDETGNVTPVLLKTITYRGPAPVITNAICQYDPSGVGTRIIINGTNFGNRGSSTVRLVDDKLDANILAWNDEIPTSTPTIISSVTGSPSITNGPSITENPQLSTTPTATPTPASVEFCKTDVDCGVGKKCGESNCSDVPCNLNDSDACASLPPCQSQCVSDPNAIACTSGVSTCATGYVCTNNICRPGVGVVVSDGDNPSPTSPASSPTTSFPDDTVLGASVMRSRVVALVKNKLAEGSHKIEFKTDDGTVLSSSCEIGLTTIDLTVKTQCLPPANFSQKDVRIQLYEKNVQARPIFDGKVIITQDGSPAWLQSPKLEVGKTYILVLKAPKSLAISKEFTALEGTTELEDITLPVGDIAPLGSTDNVINSNDYGQLKRDWIVAKEPTTAKTGDFNLDNRVNSIDYSCMVQNFNKTGASFLKAQ